MLQIEQIKERVKDLYAEVAALPDPRDEPVPRKREQLMAQRQRLTNEANLWHFAVSEWSNVERRMQQLIPYRDALLLGREKLQSDLVTARAAYAEATRKSGERSARQERSRVATIEFSLRNIENGFSEFGVQDTLKQAVAGLTFTWLDYSLPHTERLISDLREQWLATLSKLGDTEAARALALRKELWRIEEELANCRVSGDDLEVAKSLSADHKLIVDELIALGEFARESAAAAA